MSLANPAFVPAALRRDGKEFLIIDWTDGHTSRYDWPTLRASCPCASCKEAREQPRDPFQILKPGELVPLVPVAMTPVGRYAYKISWSDGHDTGIYTLEHLRSLCRCNKCLAASSARPS